MERERIKYGGYCILNRINLENGATFEVVHLNLFLLGISFEVKEKNIWNFVANFIFIAHFAKINRGKKIFLLLM